MIRFDPASFKDPAGRVFYHADGVYRTLAPVALDSLRAAQRAGLIEALTSDGVLVEGEIIPATALGVDGAPIGEFVLKQRRIPFVSYPYEWSFEMLRDAALTTLTVMERALAAGFILKDATAFNILFDGVKPVLVDTPSIEPYVEGGTWAGYAQFCRSFLFPLLLAAYRDIDVQALLRGVLGEIPASQAARMFRLRDYRRAGVFKDVVLQARLEDAFGGSAGTVRRESSEAKYPKTVLLSNVRRLRSLIEGLKPPSRRSEWSAYESDCNYSSGDRETKQAFVAQFFAGREFDRIADLGCNIGTYSRLALGHSRHVIAADLDARAIDQLYQRTDRRDPVSPIVANLLNPTPAMGWRLQERRPLLERLSSSGFLALALVHHLRIGGNVPLEDVVAQLLEIAPEGVIEWVDKTDSQVQRMLALRPDVFDDYTWPNFERLIRTRATIVSIQTTHGGARRLCHVRCA